MPAATDLADALFSTPEGRALHGDVLAVRLAAAFKTRGASEWEALLTQKGVACVEADAGPSQNTLMMPGGLAHQLGMTATVEHPLFGEHPRLKSVMSFSRSQTRAEPGIMIGQHTDLMLRELGYTDAQLEDLARREVIRRG
jgi:crotonobetainyl-CoA:carnitine CoA-transferase CaiB-like acyl-CoA transferase